MQEILIEETEVNSLPGLFRARLAKTPDALAYRQYDVASQKWTQTSWREMANEIARWQAAFIKDGLQAGDKVAVMLRNSREWVVFDQAALGLGLVTVPLYVDDRADNVAYIIHHAEVKTAVRAGQAAMEATGGRGYRPRRTATYYQYQAHF